MSDGTGPISIGVIGGAGLDTLLDDAEQRDVDTPYGPTSAPVVVGTIGGRAVAFIPRHDARRTRQPHQIPYRANIWALARLGVRALITASGVSSVRETFAPGTFVVTDQLIDFTSGRPSTFYDEGGLVRATTIEPFDTTLRSIAVEALSAQQVRFRDFGTTVVVQGPRFPTRAEARYYAAIGGDVYSMTLAPETTLAIELGMGVVNIAFVTESEAIALPAHRVDSTAELVERRLTQAAPTIRRAITAVATQMPRVFTPEALVPADAISRVLARPVH